MLLCDLVLAGCVVSCFYDLVVAGCGASCFCLTLWLLVGGLHVFV